MPNLAAALIAAVVAATVVALTSVTASAQTKGTPVEVVPGRPGGAPAVTPLPQPSPLNVSPTLQVPTAPTPAPALPTLVAPPAAAGPAPPAAQIQKSRPRQQKCWCYAWSPAQKGMAKSTCEVGCCRDARTDERC